MGYGVRSKAMAGIIYMARLVYSKAGNGMVGI